MPLPNPYFRILTVEHEDSVRIALHGELDRAMLLTVARELLEIERHGTPVVVLDLTELTFVDAGGLRLMRDASVRLRATGRQLTLANPSASLRRLLQLTAIDQTADVVDEVLASATPD
jgi:anti-anti-sigma factor